MRYVVYSKVVNVFEKEKYVSARIVDRGLPTQHVDSVKENLGWYVTITEGISLCLGREKPHFNPGDTLQITLQKMP